MSIHAGSFSLTRFRVLTGAKKLSIADLNKNLKAYQAKPLKLQGVFKELIAGWVRPVGLENEDVAPDAHWDMSDCQVGDGYLLRFRVDKRKVPRELLQMVLKNRIAAEEEKREGKPLGRAQRKELMDRVKEELLEQCLPNVRYVDAFWHEERGEVMLFNSGRQAAEIFEDLFRKSFAEPHGLSLVKVTPPLLGLSNEEWQGVAEGEDRLGRMASALPTSFAAEVSG